MITVFTPSYNRKAELKELYFSLIKQNYNDFEWLIVDDGSTDGTHDLITELQNENKININYIYKENGGKQSAYNVGLNYANGDVFFCIDSDDALKENKLGEIAKDFTEIHDGDIAGIMYLQGYINNKDKVIGSYFPDNLIDTYYNIYHKNGVTGDKLIVYKTSVAKEFYFPIIDGEKFVPEALIYNRMSKKYKFICKNIVMAYKEYLDSGYSADYFNLVKRNPNGNALYYLELYDFNKSFYNVYGYLLYSFYAKKNIKDIFKHPSKCKISLLYLPVKLLSIVRR